MEWGLLFLSAATTGVSTILGAVGTAVTTTTPASETSASARGGLMTMTTSVQSLLESTLAGTDRLRLTTDPHCIFLSGAVLGMGISLLLSTVNSYFRLAPSLRLFWRFMSNTDESKELFPFRIPTSATKGGGDDTTTAADATTGSSTSPPLNSNSNSNNRVQSLTLVDPTMATTAHLHVQHLTLPPYHELPPRRSAAVEFYYVIAGSGVMSQQGIPIRQTLSVGDCCVVDARHMRWFKNTHATQSLILLRTTDGPCHPTDRIRIDPNHRPDSISSSNGSSCRSSTRSSTRGPSTTTGTMEGSDTAAVSVIATKGQLALPASANDYCSSVDSTNNSNNSNNKTMTNVGRDKTQLVSLLLARKKTVVAVDGQARYSRRQRPLETLVQ